MIDARFIPGPVYPEFNPSDFHTETMNFPEAVHDLYREYARRREAHDRQAAFLLFGIHF